VPGAVPGALTSSSINDEGVVVGFYDTAAGTTVGFIRSRLGVLTAPVVAPYDNVTNTLLHSVNDEGVMVGFYSSDNLATTHGFYLVDGQFTTYDYPGAFSTALRGINNRGDITGTTATSSPSDPGTGFIVPRGRDPISFAGPFPAAAGLAVEAINDRRAVVGYSVFDNSPARGFLRKPDGSFVEIALAGAGPNRAFGINDCGVIVGWYAMAGVLHGFYGRAGNLQSLVVPGASATQAFGINNEGRISGAYADANGAWHGFITGEVDGALCD